MLFIVNAAHIDSLNGMSKVSILCQFIILISLSLSLSLSLALSTSGRPAVIVIPTFVYLNSENDQ